MYHQRKVIQRTTWIGIYKSQVYLIPAQLQKGRDLIYCIITASVSSAALTMPNTALKKYLLDKEKCLPDTKETVFFFF